MAAEQIGRHAPAGVARLHGFTGSRASVDAGRRGASAAAGFAVEVPLLPGHGTSPDDLDRTAYAEWLSCVEERYASLDQRCGSVGLFGLSMGGALPRSSPAHHRAISGVALVNPFAQPVDPAFVAILDAAVAGGSTSIPSIGSDIARPEHPLTGGYDETPVRPLLSLVDGVGDARRALGSVTAPVLLFSSKVDHVVPTSTGAYLEAHLGGPVERIVLEKSFHVATLDYDGDEIVRRTVEFM